MTVILFFFGRWVCAVSSVMGCRLLLSMFEHAFKSALESDGTQGGTDLQSIVFAYPHPTYVSFRNIKPIDYIDELGSE